MRQFPLEEFGVEVVISALKRRIKANSWCLTGGHHANCLTFIIEGLSKVFPAQESSLINNLRPHVPLEYREKLFVHFILGLATNHGRILIDELAADFQLIFLE